MDYQALYDEMDVRLGDSDNFTFTIEEKESALNEAIHDDHVTVPIWSTTLTYTTGTYQYAKPTGIDVVQDIYLQTDDSQDSPVTISADLWEVVGDNIQFKNSANNFIPSNWGLLVKGKTKGVVSDTYTDTGLQEYILNLAQYNCVKQLGTKKALKFLKNDTSLAEVVTWKRELERDVINYRRRQPVSFESAQQWLYMTSPRQAPPAIK